MSVYCGTSRLSLPASNDKNKVDWTAHLWIIWMNRVSFVSVNQSFKYKVVKIVFCWLCVSDGKRSGRTHEWLFLMIFSFCSFKRQITSQNFMFSAVCLIDWILKRQYTIRQGGHRSTHTNLVHVFSLISGYKIWRVLITSKELKKQSTHMCRRNIRTTRSK